MPMVGPAKSVMVSRGLQPANAISTAKKARNVAGWRMGGRLPDCTGGLAAQAEAVYPSAPYGEVAEWSKALDWNSSYIFTGVRGFESHPLRQKTHKRPERGVSFSGTEGWAENPRDVGSTNRTAICTPCRRRRTGRPSGARPMRGPSESHPLRQKTQNAPKGAFRFLEQRDGLRTHGTWGRQIALRFARPVAISEQGAPMGRGPCVGRVNPTLSAGRAHVLFDNAPFALCSRPLVDALRDVSREEITLRGKAEHVDQDAQAFVEAAANSFTRMIQPPEVPWFGIGGRICTWPRSPQCRHRTRKGT